MNELLVSIKAQIIALIKATPGINLISEKLLQNALDGFSLLQDGNRKLSEGEKSVLYKELCNYFIADLNYENDLVQLERGIMLKDSDPKLHTEWEPDSTTRFYWRKQRDFLVKVLTKRDGADEASKIINSIDFETNEILRNMENPRRLEFDSRGLVLGYVQSGKTANFTALISKAADAGYRFIVVLAGIHDELRQQTQIRIDRELTGHNNLVLGGEFVEWNDFEEPRRWYNLTSAGYLDGKETGEFSGKGVNRFADIFLSKERPALVILKKNVKILERLIKWIEASKENDRINTPLLIIDDEADQASIDSNANKGDTDPTKTNARIRRILNLFPRTAYVGYTATPFANVFIGHDKVNDGLKDDLYPRNFIHSLPEAKGYFGTKRIFHDDLDGLFVEVISDPANERKQLADNGNLTTDVASSIYGFILGIAIRNLRGQADRPMSMMINVDHRVNKMNRIGETVETYIKNLPHHYDLKALNRAYDDFIQKAFKLNEKLETGNLFPSRGKIMDEAVKVIASKSIKVRVLNSSKEDKLDYAKEPSMKVVAIGGNKLSRGLTLEGLMVTFYLRESKQYDTLLQMGRWFGFRKGYEDLVRIHTSENLWNHFKELAIVELDFRADIQEMVKDGKTPREFAIGVRQILGLLPTTKNRLGAAVFEENYAGKQVSVTWLPLETPEIIDENTKRTHRLIEQIISESASFIPVGSGKFPTLITKDIPSKYLISYMTDFSNAKGEDGKDLDFDKETLMKFIHKGVKQGEFKMWNVAIVSIGRVDDENTISLPGGIKVNPVNRARMKMIRRGNGVYTIKAISDKNDRKIDLSPTAQNEYDGRNRPLMLIYFISRKSKPMKSAEQTSRENLYQGISNVKHRDPVSFSVIFPGDSRGVGRFIQSIPK